MPLVARLATLALAVAALAACQSPPPRPSAADGEPIDPVIAAISGDGLRYADGAPFDRALSAAMAGARGTIDVRVDGAADVNALPVRLERWLSTIRQTGGRVRAQPLPESGSPYRPIVTEVPVRLVDTRPDPAPFIPARDYDATVLYARRDGSIVHIVFERRQALR